MDHGSDAQSRAGADGPTPARAGPRLTLVRTALRLTEPTVPAPQEWRAALGELLGWLGVEVEILPPPRPDRLARLPGLRPRAPRAGEGVPVFAPWTAWCPTAFQNGGSAGLPDAEFVASYALEHHRAFAEPWRGDADIMLLSPHPAACIATTGDSAMLPRAGTMRAMIRAAVAEGRERIAILVHARHRTAMHALRLAEDPRLCPPGVRLEIAAIEEALPLLVTGAGRWEAIITMPDLRGMVFAMVGQATRMRGPWPMLWSVRDRLVQITAEALGQNEGASAGQVPLDAALLTHALTLGLHAAGFQVPAARLHAGWARLRGSGVTTTGRGDDAPYVTEVPDAEFVTLLCRDTVGDHRLPITWRALKCQQKSVFGNREPGLRIVPANIASC